MIIGRGKPRLSLNSIVPNGWNFLSAVGLCLDKFHLKEYHQSVSSSLSPRRTEAETIQKKTKKNLFHDRNKSKILEELGTIITCL